MDSSYFTGTLQGMPKTGPLCFTACNFRNIDKICIKFGTIKVILFLTLIRNLFESTLENKWQVTSRKTKWPGFFGLPGISVFNSNLGPILLGLRDMTVKHSGRGPTSTCCVRCPYLIIRLIYTLVRQNTN